MPIGMLTTQTPDGVTHCRPMVVDAIDENGWLWFLTDRSSRNALELIQNPQATIAFQSTRGDRYVSVQGTAIVVQDDAKVKRMWKPAVRAWFPRGHGELDVVLIAVRVARAEYWLVPRRINRMVTAATSLMTGRRADAGRHGILDLYPAPV